jgi:hypothetical protein
MICLIFGLASVFRFLQLYQEKKPNRKTRELIAQGALIAMTVYLLKEADSATALSCFGLAGSVMVLTYLYAWARKPAVMHLMVVAVLSVAFSALFLGIGSGLVEDLGRESTLTGRTAIWQSALGLVRNPLLGTGFESFWIGPRLRQVEIDINQGVNQAHDGYIEIFLNLGWVGIALLVGLIVTGYRRVAPAVRQRTQLGSLRLAFLIVALAYNFTEGGFKMMHPVWIVFLLTIAIVPRNPSQRRPLKIGMQLDGSQRTIDRPNKVQDLIEEQTFSRDFANPHARFTG